MDAYRFNRLLQKIKYDKQAIVEIYKEYFPKIFIHLKRRFGKLISAEDIVHEVFCTLMATESFSKVDYPTAWIYRIADNKAIDKIKTQHQEIELTENYSVPFRLDELILKEDTKKAILQLDEKTQMILYLNHWEGYTFKEIAEQLNLSHANVRTKACRAYKAMRIYL